MVCVSILTTQSRCQQRLAERFLFREARHPKRLKAAVMFQIIQGNRFTRGTGRDRHLLMHFIEKMAEAAERYAYRQNEIARHLSLHVSTVSNSLRGRG